MGKPAYDLFIDDKNINSETFFKSKHQEKIYEVELLDGFEKNRKYFVIKEDLVSDFILMEQSNES